LAWKLQTDFIIIKENLIENIQNKNSKGDRCSTVFKVLCYKLIGRRFDSRLLLEFFIEINILAGDRGGTVVKVLCYKSEGRCFDSRFFVGIFN